MRFAIVAVLGLAACGGGAAHGEQLYTDANCVECHGADGRLQADINDEGEVVEGGDDDTDTPKSADLTVAVPAMSDDELDEVLRNGKTPMPPATTAEGLLTSDDREDLIDYLRQQFGGEE